MSQYLDGKYVLPAKKRGLRTADVSDSVCLSVCLCVCSFFVRLLYGPILIDQSENRLLYGPILIDQSESRVSLLTNQRAGPVC